MKLHRVAPQHRGGGGGLVAPAGLRIQDDAPDRSVLPPAPPAVSSFLLSGPGLMQAQTSPEHSQLGFCCHTCHRQRWDLGAIVEWPHMWPHA